MPSLFPVGPTWIQQIEEDPGLSGFTGVVTPSNFSGDALPLLKRIYERKRKAPKLPKGCWRETIDSALEKAFKELHIDNRKAKDALMILIDAYIKNMLDILERKQE